MIGSAYRDPRHLAPLPSAETLIALSKRLGPERAPDLYSDVECQDADRRLKLRGEDG